MQPQFKRRLLKFRPYILPTLLLGIFFVFIFFLVYCVLPLFRFARENNITPRFLVNLILGHEAPMKRYQGRTNLVILGIADGQHPGVDLADTIIFLSINFNKSEAVMISLARDLWLPSFKDKINSSYHYGEEKRKGGGLPMAKAAVEEVVGLPVYYGLIVDFSGFKQLIDLIGGVEIFVEEGFTDNLFPIEGKEDDFCGGDPTFACRYEKVKFEKGWQLMDGEMALKYVRSRMAEGEQGSDFAREKRQQQVLLAFKNKLSKSANWRSFKKFGEIFSTVNKLVITDMNWSEKMFLLRFFLTLKDNKVRRLVLDDFLINPPIWEYDGTWVLVPKSGDFGEIQKYVSCHLRNPNCSLEP